MSRCMTKPTKSPVRPAKTQISLGIRPVWSESPLCAQWVVKDPSFLRAGSEYTDQTGRMPRLIRVFTGRTGHLVRFVVLRLNYRSQGFHAEVVTYLKAKVVHCPVLLCGLLQETYKTCITSSLFSKWATTSQNQQNECQPSLIRVFAIRMMKAWVLSYPLSA